MKCETCRKEITEISDVGVLVSIPHYCVFAVCDSCVKRFVTIFSPLFKAIRYRVDTEIIKPIAINTEKEFEELQAVLLTVVKAMHDNVNSKTGEKRIKENDSGQIRLGIFGSDESTESTGGC